MEAVLLGNIISFVGCGLMVFIGFIKKRERIIVLQCFQFAIQAVGHFVLGAYMGSITCVVSLLRNVVFARRNVTVRLKLIFILIQLLLSVGGLGDGWIAWMPVLAAVLFTWFLDTKSGVVLKTVIIITQVMWLIYDFSNLNYAAVAFDTFTIVSTTIGIGLILKDRRESKK